MSKKVLPAYAGLIPGPPSSRQNEPDVLPAYAGLIPSLLKITSHPPRITRIRGFDSVYDNPSSWESIGITRLCGFDSLPSGFFEARLQGITRIRGFDS